MSGTPNKTGAQNYGLTNREVELTVKAMITMLESGSKPDFEKLANMTQYKDATAAAKNWHFTATKLKKAGRETDGEAGGNKAAGGTKSKRKAADDHVAPPAKRGRVYKNDDDDEEQVMPVKAEDDETGA